MKEAAGAVKEAKQGLENVNDIVIEANAWKMTPEELWSYIKKLEIEKLIN